MFAPGCARLATRPLLTGSTPTTNTIGIVFVAALARSRQEVMATRGRPLQGIGFSLDGPKAYGPRRPSAIRHAGAIVQEMIEACPTLGCRSFYSVGQPTMRRR